MAMQRKFLRVITTQILTKRFYKKNAVRVRFAPSPTGHLHLGGLRTALYNYLFTRAHNGSFILRIEDTDQTRIQPGAMEKLQEDLFWAGIIPDEDPLRGGPAGPYVQSKRLDIYKEELKKLLANGSAYYCFCTERRLEMVRKEFLRTGQIPKYDNRCRNLTKEEIQEKMRTSKGHCVRFKMLPEQGTFDDLVYGKIECTSTQIEGDPIIYKSDGYPTYHFANVVDDHLMEISHVLRGVEWQISTPKHIQIYKAFGWEPPLYAHLPLILNSNGTKLSKRQDDIQVSAYRKQGIFPMALINYIICAGGGFNRDSKKQHCYSYEELIKQFDIKRINVNSTKLEPEKLLEFNALEIRKLLENEKNYKFLVNRISKLVRDAFSDKYSNESLQLDEDHVMSVLKWAQCRIHKLDDLVTRDFAFLWIVPENLQVANDEKSLETVKILCEKLDEIEQFEPKSLMSFLRDIAQKNDIKFSTMMKMLRGILSGLEEGPSVAEMMTMLGRDETILRLKRVFS